MNRQTGKIKILIMFNIVFSFVTFDCIFTIALLLLQIFAQEVTTIFLTDGFIPILQLTVLLLTAIAATLAVAYVHCPTSIKLVFLCCKYKYSDTQYQYVV